MLSRGLPNAPAFCLRRGHRNGVACCHAGARGGYRLPWHNGSPKDLASARAHPADYIWGADDKLKDFVLKHLPKTAAGGDADCTTPETIASNLDIAFKPGDKVVFAIDRMPFVAADCDNDLFDMPIAKLKDLLTPAAGDYFPSLAAK
jgi:hypothetical protein